MKEAPNIDELLNGYVDEELTQRQMTEVQRLIANDEAIAIRLRELQRCKMLVGSLPFAEAPGDMLADIRARLERSSLLESGPEIVERQRGSRGLLLRKVLSAAAMIALIGGLAAVVFVIVTPEGEVKGPVARGVSDTPGAIGAGATSENSQTISGTAGITEGLLKARLELRTGTFFAVEALVSGAIEKRGLQEKSSWQTEDNMAVYSIKCSRSEATLLLSELADIWPRFESASLYVESAGEADGAWVDRVKPSQVMEIVGQGSNERMIKATKWFAIQNGMTNPLSDDRAVAGDGGKAVGARIPQPVLTRDEDNVRDGRGEIGYDRRIEFTIMVRGTE